MSETSKPNERGTANAVRELGQLHGPAGEACVVRNRLQQDVVAAENHPGIQAVQALAADAPLNALTERPNRVRVLDRFKQAITDATRHNTRLALLLLDINNFKQIEDTLGSVVGDEALKLAAQCLASSVRAADTVTRHGGGEFLVLLTEVYRAADAVLFANRVIATLGVPRRVGDHVVRLTVSIGISLYPDDGEDAGTLIERANDAMLRAKRNGPGSFVFHGDEAPSKRGRQAPSPTLTQRPVNDDEPTLTGHERRHAQLQEANEHLVLAALSAQELQSVAERAHRRQTEFLAVLAHELRSPLTPIRTVAALLGRIPLEELPKMQAIIERQVMHLSRLVGDLLDASRVNTGKLRLKRRLVDMTGIIEGAVDISRPAMDTRQQHFSVQVPACALEIHGDPVRLTQVVSNLLDNASKYTPNGGRIELVVALLGDALVMTVADNGIGMTAEALPHVFEPFVQHTQATGFNGGGLGIGLMVVRELVEAHGGSVVATSAGSGLGSQFVVTFPLNALPGG